MVLNRTFLLHIFVRFSGHGPQVEDELAEKSSAAWTIADLERLSEAGV